MPITQISIDVENKPGMLNNICEILEKEQINIKAIMAFSVLDPVQIQLIVNDPKRAENVLKSNEFSITTKEVIAVATPDHPGGLNAVLRPLKEAGINIETLYPFIYHSSEDAIMIIEVDNIKEAKKVLKKHWVKTYSKEIYKM